MLPGGAGDGIDAVSTLSHDYPKARLAFCGFSAANRNLIKRLADLGVDPSRINMQSQSRTTFEDAFYSATLLKPKPSERWLLITSGMHMPRAVGCFRVAGFQVEAYPVEFTTRGRSSPFFPVRYRLLSFDPTRPSRKGVDRPRRLSPDGQDRCPVSAAIDYRP